jgi:prepilin-type N-terminal cleavage/methylation domain-containing protein
MTKRRGVSLIELLVVIVMMSAVFGLTGFVFHKLFQSEQITMQSALMELSTSRLADQFRRDAHRATIANVARSADGNVDEIELKETAESESAIVYTGRDGRVDREQLSAGLTTARESYRLPGCVVSFSDRPTERTPQDSPPASRLVELTIQRRGTTVTPQPEAVRPMRVLRIEAHLGREASWSGGHSESTDTEAKESTNAKPSETTNSGSNEVPQ